MLELEETATLVMMANPVLVAPAATMEDAVGLLEQIAVEEMDWALVVAQGVSLPSEEIALASLMVVVVAVLVEPELPALVVQAPRLLAAQVTAQRSYFHQSAVRVVEAVQEAPLLVVRVVAVAGAQF